MTEYHIILMIEVIMILIAKIKEFIFIIKTDILSKRNYILF